MCCIGIIFEFFTQFYESWDETHSEMFCENFLQDYYSIAKRENFEPSEDFVPRCNNAFDLYVIYLKNSKFQHDLPENYLRNMESLYLQKTLLLEDFEFVRDRCLSVYSTALNIEP